MKKLIGIALVVVVSGIIFLGWKNYESNSRRNLSENFNNTESLSLEKNQSGTAGSQPSAQEEKPKNTSSAVSQSSNATYQSYTSTNAGISFQYKKTPNGYVVKEEEPVELTNTTGVMIAIFKASEQNAKTEEELSSGITISTYSDIGYTSSLEWAENEPRTNFPQRINKEYQSITIGGMNAIRYSSPRHPYMINGKPYTRSDGSTMYIDATDSVAIVHNGKGTTITLSYKDKNDSIHTDFETFLASIKFVK